MFRIASRSRHIAPSRSDRARRSGGAALQLAEPGIVLAPVRRRPAAGVGPKPARPSDGVEEKQPWHVFNPLGLAAVNTVGNLFALAAAASHDHMQVRALAACASLSVAAFNFLMPKPLKAHQQTAGGWGSAFAVLHLVNLAILMHEHNHGVTLTDEEEDIYEHGFQRFGVTPRQFTKIMRAATFEDLRPGEQLAQSGRPVNRVFYVVHGACHAETDGTVRVEYHQDVFVGMLEPKVYQAEYAGKDATKPQRPQSSQDPYGCGGEDGAAEDEMVLARAEQKSRRMRGEARRDIRALLAAGLEEKTGRQTRLRIGEAWQSCVVAGSEGCRVLSWPLGAFSNLVGSDHKLVAAMERLEEIGLASKITAGIGRKVLLGYQELLAASLCDGRIDPEEKHALRRYRVRHAVPESEHARMLEELGWTPAEFEDGIKSNVWSLVVKSWLGKRPSTISMSAVSNS